MDIGDIVDLERYPLDQPDSRARHDLLSVARASLAEAGGCELPGFLQREAVEALVAGAVSSAARAHRSDDVHSIFFEPLPAREDPRDPRSLR